MGVCASIVGAQELVGAAMVAGAGKSVMLSEKKAQDCAEMDELRERRELKRQEKQERERKEGVKQVVKKDRTQAERKALLPPGHEDAWILGARGSFKDVEWLNSSKARRKSSVGSAGSSGAAVAGMNKPSSKPSSRDASPAPRPGSAGSSGAAVAGMNKPSSRPSSRDASPVTRRDVHPGEEYAHRPPRHEPRRGRNSITSYSPGAAVIAVANKESMRGGMLAARSAAEVYGGGRELPPPPFVRERSQSVSEGIGGGGAPPRAEREKSGGWGARLQSRALADKLSFLNDGERDGRAKRLGELSDSAWQGRAAGEREGGKRGGGRSRRSSNPIA